MPLVLSITFVELPVLPKGVQRTGSSTNVMESTRGIKPGEPEREHRDLVRFPEPPPAPFQLHPLPLGHQAWEGQSCPCAPRPAPRAPLPAWLAADPVPERPALEILPPRA